MLLDCELVFVLGGVRSGKSRHAESIVQAWPHPWTYVATAQALDQEMVVRIDSHRERRGEDWRTLEVPLELAGAIRNSGEGVPVLVDCLTMWLSNHLLSEHDLEIEMERLAAAIMGRRGPLCLVANEVGFGVVPENALARRFRDAAGVLNQRMARLADRVVFVVAGLPLVLKE